MAEAIFNADPPTGWRATSAGTEPGRSANPRVRPMLQEIGIPAPAHPPTPLTGAMMEDSSVRITMGCLDSASCPARLKTLEVTDWALPDPATLDDEGFRRVRDDIRLRVQGLVRELALRERLRPKFGTRAPPA